MMISNIFLMIVLLIQTIIIRKQGKLILSYDNNLKKQGNMGRLMFLANLAKVKGNDITINYSTMSDYSYVLFYKKGRRIDKPPVYKIVTFNDETFEDETFEEAIKELERLIK